MARDSIHFDPDETRKHDGAYWAAAAIVADRAGDTDRAELARKNLRRLGYRMDRLPNRSKAEVAVAGR